MEWKGCESIIHDHDCDLWVTMVGWVDVPYSDWGDFRRRRAVDISSFICVVGNFIPWCSLVAHALVKGLMWNYYEKNMFIVGFHLDSSSQLRIASVSPSKSFVFAAVNIVEQIPPCWNWSDCGCISQPGQVLVISNINALYRVICKHKKTGIMNSERFIEVSVRSSRVDVVQIRLTLWGWDKMAAIIQTFSAYFFQWKSLYFY